MDKKEPIDAKSLMSIANFWGEDITPEQESWLATEAEDLPEKEKGKFFDFYLLSDGKK